MYRANNKGAGGPGVEDLHILEENILYPKKAGSKIGEVGMHPGDWKAGTKTVDVSKVQEYYKKQPYRRTLFVLDRKTGKERYIAPIAWCGTHGGNRYPPAVGSNNVLYLKAHNNWRKGMGFPAGNSIMGWTMGTHYLAGSLGGTAMDEPEAFSAAGDMVYYNLCCDRMAAGRNMKTGENYKYWGYDLDDRFKKKPIIPTYNRLFSKETEMTGIWGEYRDYVGTLGKNGVYGLHGDQNPLIPHKGMLFTHRSNCLIGLGSKESKTELPMAKKVAYQGKKPLPPKVADLKKRLSEEVKKITSAPYFLRPGLINHYAFSWRINGSGYALGYYFSDPSDTIIFLLRTLPHLPAEQQTELKAYLKKFLKFCPPYKYSHIGWQGAAREAFDIPEDMKKEFNVKPSTPSYFNGFKGYRYPPQYAYACWQFAKAGLGDPKKIFAQVKKKWSQTGKPNPKALDKYPHAHNAWIAGLVGYLELEKMATGSKNKEMQTQLDELMASRAKADWRKDIHTNDIKKIRFVDRITAYEELQVSRNFLYLTPELCDYLKNNAKNKVQQSWQDMTYVAPRWFVAKAEDMSYESVIGPIHKTQALFYAKAKILDAPYEELVMYLDTPAFARGDLYYIDNLVSCIEAGGKNKN